jgi:hypothetical protein
MDISQMMSVLKCVIYIAILSQLLNPKNPSWGVLGPPRIPRYLYTVDLGRGEAPQNLFNIMLKKNKSYDKIRNYSRNYKFRD